MSVHQTRESLAPGARAALDELLADGEEFLGGIDCRDAFVLRDRRRTKLFLTDRRVIEYRRGLFGGATTAHDRERVATATVSRALFFYQLTLSGPGFLKTFRVDPTAGRQFADAVSSVEPRPIAEAGGFGAHRKLDGIDGRGDDGDESVGGTAEVDPAIASGDLRRWHYGVVLAAVATLAGALGNSLGLLALGYVAIPVTIYLDIRGVEASDSRWQPDRGLYLVGAIIFPLIAVPMYLYRRRETVGL